MSKVNQANRIDLIGWLTSWWIGFKNSVIEVYEDFTRAEVIQEHIETKGIEAHEDKGLIRGLEEETTSYYIPLEKGKGIVPTAIVNEKEAQEVAERKQETKLKDEKQITRDK